MEDIENIIQQILKMLSSYRIDMKNFGSENNALEIIAENVFISEPTWSTDTQGTGKMLQGNTMQNSIKIKVINDGHLRINFRGQDKRFDGTRYPVWIDYKSIKVDGKEILSKPVATWHDEPYNYGMQVKDGQQVTLEIEQRYHEYTERGLKDLLLKLYFNNEYLQNNIDYIFELLCKHLPIIDEETYQKCQSEKCIQEILENLTVYRIDIKNIGNDQNDVEIKAESCKITKQLHNAQGNITIIESNSLNQKIEIKVIKNGLLHIDFKGIGKKINNIPFQWWIDYKSIKINGKKIFEEPIETLLGEPCGYEMPVSDGQEIILEIEQQYHQYNRKALKNFILRLNPNNSYCSINIEKLTDKLMRSFPKDIINISNNKIIHIYSQLETLDCIYFDKMSIARYGDGEVCLMLGIGNPKYQDPNFELQQRLKEILCAGNKNMLICLGDYYRPGYLTNNKYLINHLINVKNALGNAIDPLYFYGNTNITRHAGNVLYLKKIWNNKDIIVVEGELSRMGVGNDLFDNVKSLKRILCPAVNAFDSYDRILEECKKQSKDALFLIALGPTATVLAYDLADLGYWTLDIGHIDIVYEWSKLGPGRHLVAGKYVNEVVGGNIVEDCTDPDYLNSIIAKVV